MAKQTWMPYPFELTFVTTHAGIRSADLRISGGAGAARSGEDLIYFESVLVHFLSHPQINCQLNACTIIDVSQIRMSLNSKTASGKSIITMRSIMRTLDSADASGSESDI